MNTTPNSEQTTETVDTQDAPVSIKLDDVTGGWWGYGYGPAAYGWGAPWAGPGPYGNPYAAARYAAAFDRRAAWYAANAPAYAPAYRPWWA
jgi:hypothetical protein